MRENLKNNTKIKLIALLSAVVLWMYVMAVVDPEETKIFEDVPIKITNMDELNDKDLVIYPDVELTTNIYITGKLSTIQKISKEDINVYGEIRDPIEGNNDIYLRVTQSLRVTYEFKNQVKIVNLEKVIKEKRTVDIEIEGNSKDNIDAVELQNATDGVTISGPRSLVEQVDKVVAVLNTENRVEDFETKLKVTPIDIKGNTVDGVELEQESVNVKVKLLKEKTVPIRINFTEDTGAEINLDDYKLSQDSVVIKGKKEAIDKIEYINTQPIGLLDINQSNSKDVNLEIPSDIICETKYITIKSNIVSKVTNQFTYSSQDVKIINDENIDITEIKIPENIEVIVEYDSSVGTITKNDINLYVDLSKESTTEGKYKIGYETNFEIKTITINPSITE